MRCFGDGRLKVRKARSSGRSSVFGQVGRRSAPRGSGPPNKSFKPTPHRGVNSVLYATLHAVATPPWGGLTPALELMDTSELAQQKQELEPTDTPEVIQQKNIEMYSASVAAWFNSSLEYDKSLLTLSTAGVGLLITLLTTAKEISTLSLTLYTSALCSFLVCIFCVLSILSRNKNRIEKHISDPNCKSDPLLRKLDYLAFCAFALGALFSVSIGITSATSLPPTEKKDMGNKTPPNSVPGIGMDSFDNMANLKPQVAQKPAAPAPAPKNSQDSSGQDTAKSQQKARD